MPEEILELSDLAPSRTKVRLRTKADPDGTVYELTRPLDLGAVATHLLGQKLQAIQELWHKPNSKAADRKRLTQLLNETGKVLILDAPADAVAALDDDTKFELGIRFLAAAGTRAISMMGPGARSMLESLQPDSSPSTAETP